MSATSAASVSVCGSQIGFGFYIDLHIGRLTVRQGHRLSHQVEDEILQAIPRGAEARPCGT